MNSILLKAMIIRL